MIADAKTSERRQFLVSAFKRLSNRPYVIRLLGRIKQTAEDHRNVVEPKFQAAEEALFKAEDKFKANPNDAAAKADYEAKEKIYNELASQKTGEDKVITRPWKRSGRRLCPPGRPLPPMTGRTTNLPSSRRFKRLHRPYSEPEGGQSLRFLYVREFPSLPETRFPCSRYTMGSSLGTSGSCFLPAVAKNGRRKALFR